MNSPLLTAGAEQPPPPPPPTFRYTAPAEPPPPLPPTFRYIVWVLLGGLEGRAAHRHVSSAASRAEKTVAVHARIAKWVQAFTVLLILANVLAVILVSSLDKVTSTLNRTYQRFELGSVCYFGLEYLLRLYSCVEEPIERRASTLRGCLRWRRLRWALGPLALLDLLALVPFVYDLSVPSDDRARGATLLRLLRLSSLLRLDAWVGGFEHIYAVLRSKGRELLVTLFIASIMLVVSASLMYYIESPYNDAYSDIVTSMWWAVTALTTVGYGDIYPVTPLGKLVGSAVAFIGVGFFALPAGIIGSGFVEVMIEEQRSSGADRLSGVQEETVIKKRAEVELLVLKHAIRSLKEQQPALALGILEDRLSTLTSNDVDEA